MPVERWNEEGNKQIRYLHVAVLTLVLTLLPLLAMGGGTVPRATCGPDDRTESGLQGQTTAAEQSGAPGSADSEQGYNCNLELVGQTQGEGASWQMAWFDDCAYYNTANGDQQDPGTVVVDASDPRNPQVTEFLTEPTMLDPWESLKVNKKRKLLAGVQNGGSGFAIYDVSDCRDPELLASVVLPDNTLDGHGGDFAPDGLTYWGTSITDKIFAIDVSDPSNPTFLGTFLHNAHDLSISKDGTRAYLGQLGNAPVFGLNDPNGLVIVDVSDIQFRRPNPVTKVISTLFWEDGSIAQLPQLVTIRDKPHLIFTDEGGSGGLFRPAVVDACARGLPPYGFARIIDISNERNPRIVSKLMLEVHDPDNCNEILADPPYNLFGYDSHYCGVDDPQDATILACSYFRSGIRVFDIRNPSNPKEIAYFKPGARRDQDLPGSQLGNREADRTTDWATARIRIRKHKKAKGKKAKGKKDKSKLEIWFTTQDNGFQVVRFTNGADKLGKKKKGKKGKK